MLHVGKGSVRAAVLAACLAAVLGAAGLGVCYAAAPELPRITPGTASIEEELEPPYAAVQEIVNSVSLDTEKEILSFRIPKALPEETLLYLQVSGRLRMGSDDDSGMSFHLFEEETAAYSWTPGGIYAASLDPDALLECAVAASVLDAKTGKILAAASVMVGPAGAVSSAEATIDFPPLPESGAEAEAASTVAVELGELAADGRQAFGPYALKKGDHWSVSLTWEGEAQLGVASSLTPPVEELHTMSLTTAPGGSLANPPFEVAEDGRYWFYVLNLSEGDASHIRGKILLSRGL